MAAASFAGVLRPTATGSLLMRSHQNYTRNRPARRMGWLVLALAALATLLAYGHSTEAAGPTAEEIAKRVQAFYDSTKTFKASFTQTYTIKVQNVKKISSGKVTFEKPGKM